MKWVEKADGIHSVALRYFNLQVLNKMVQLVKITIRNPLDSNGT